MDWKEVLKPTINKISFTIVLFLVIILLTDFYLVIFLMYFLTNILNLCPGYQDIAIGDCIFGMDFLKSFYFYTLLIFLILYVISSMIFYRYDKLKIQN